MFSARRPAPPDATTKRGNGALFVDASGAPVYDFAASKRPRLEFWGEFTAATSAAPRLATPDSDTVLVRTPECSVVRVRGVPAMVADEIRRERPAARQVVHCRVAVPVAKHAASSRGERHVVSYYVVALRQRIVLWQEGSGNVATLPLPDEISPDEPLHPFLLALYGARVSLLVVSRSGRVLFWEDIELPYESVPLSVQIPLQPHEQVFTNAHASLTVSSSSSRLVQATGADAAVDQEFKSILCWSSLGSVWEVAMEDRRIRVRSLERQQGGFLSGLTKTVSQFFFASTAATTTSSEIDPHAPIKAVKIMPSAGGFDGLDDDARVDKLVLFSNGSVERRSFNSIDAMDCNSTTVWHVDTNRAAIAYFSERFPDSHLAKVFMVSIPYITDTSTFGLVVAFVCTARNEETPRVKYALFQFKVQASSRSRTPEPEWACFLDYEPIFSEDVDSDEYFDVETVPINNLAFYLVWVQSQPVHFASIQLPVPGQKTVRSSGFSLQGVDRNAAVGFAPRVEVSAESSDAVKGSVSFVLMEYESLSAGGVVCAATASNMVKLYNKAAMSSEVSRHMKRVEDSDQLTPESHSLGENLSVEEYAALLLAYFQEENELSTGGPLRIATRDVSNVAQAAVGVVFQILDAKASSGLRWGTDANDQAVQPTNAAIVTPKLVRFQLEEKRSRFESFIAFVQQKCCDVWQYIEVSDDLLQYVVDCEEKLHAAVALCKFQGSIAVIGEQGPDAGVEPKLDGQLLLRAIERTIHQRGYDKEQLRLAGYNSFDIFFCEVSKISELFVGLSAEIQQVASESGEGNTKFLHCLLESGYSMQSMLKTPTATRLRSTGNWMFTRQIRESIADQISRLSSAVGYSTVPSSKPLATSGEEVFEITDQILKLGGLLLDAYRRFIPMSSGETAEDLRKEADITKRLTLNPLVFIATDYESPLEFSPLVDEGSTSWSAHKKTELFKACIALAEEYAYYEAMVFLTYREDEENLTKLDYILGRQEKSSATKRLESYCRKLTDFPAFLYRWYGGEAIRYPWGFDGESARAQMFAYMLANSSLFGPSLHAYLKTHSLLSKFAWVTAIATEKYDAVAQLSLKEATNEETSLPRRKTMASIAKIAALAGPATPLGTAEEIKRELAVGRIQEVLMELPLDISIDSRPLTPAELVGKSIDALHSISSEDPLRPTVFLIAVETLECLPADTTPVDFDTYCMRTWREAVLADTDLWSQIVDENASGVNDQKAEAMMRNTLVFKSMERYHCRLEGSQSGRAAGLTVEFIDAMVSREVDDSAASSLLDARLRHLLVKTLHLAKSS